ncbi:hypothetical protein R3P38DRAFT_1656255 [Favolaschia claudopus]|uniref:Uncharacterized protein n=1 Tax=Favolaschia claudopus TaxID=2862362 RepID=A0AAW0AE31_9AGAR
MHDFRRWMGKVRNRLRSRPSEKKTDRLPEYLSVFKSSFKLLFKLTEDLLEGTPFKIPASAVNTVLDLVDAMSDNKGDLQYLFRNIAHQLEIVNKYLTQRGSKASRDLISEFSRYVWGPGIFACYR